MSTITGRIKLESGLIGLDHWIRCYPERPFAVFSSAWPKINDKNGALYAIRRPELPQSLLGDPDKAAACKERLANRSSFSRQGFRHPSTA